MRIGSVGSAGGDREIEFDTKMSVQLRTNVIFVHCIQSSNGTQKINETNEGAL